MRIALEIAVILAIAAAVQFIPGGAQALNAFYSALVAIFAIGLFLYLTRLYREHRTDIYSLGDNRRALLYGASAVLVLTVAAKERMWHAGGGLGEFFWFALIGLAIYTYVALYRYAKRY
jgi:hypothetical protein